MTTIRSSAALSYVAKGWPVFPIWWAVGSKCGCGSEECSSVGKHPIHAPELGLTGGFKAASVNPDDVRSWWDRWPEANIGFEPGKAGLLVIDVDPRNGGDQSIEEWEAHNRLAQNAETGEPAPLSLPDTLTTYTGGDGLHLFYRLPEGAVLASEKGWLPGIDIKSTGGYVLLPPSNHASGGTYVSDETVAEPLPLAMVAAFSTAKSSGAVGGSRGSTSGALTGRLTRSTEEVLRDGFPDGGVGDPDGLGRYDGIFLFACRLKGRLTIYPEAEKLVLRAAAASRPAWPEEKALRALNSAYKYDDPDLIDPEERAWALGALAAAAVEPDAFAPSPGVVPVAPAPGSNPYAYVAWDEEFWKPKAPRYFVPHMLLEGQVGTIYSKGGLGKSLLALDIAVGLTLRGRVFDTEVESVPVLYIDRENSERGLVKRLTAMGFAGSVPDSFHYSLLGQWPALDTFSGGLALLAEVKRIGARFVVIDTLSKMVDGDENANDTWNGVHSRSMVALKELGVTVLQIDHTGKDEGRGQRGGSAKQNNADVIWRLEGVDSAGEFFKLTCEKDRDGDFEPVVFVARREFPLRHVVVEGLPLGVAVNQATEDLISDLDRLGVPDEAGRPTCEKALKDAGVSYTTKVLGAAVKARKDRSTDG